MINGKPAGQNCWRDIAQHNIINVVVVQSAVRSKTLIVNLTGDVGHDDGVVINDSPSQGGWSVLGADMVCDSVDCDDYKLTNNHQHEHRAKRSDRVSRN